MLMRNFKAITNADPTLLNLNQAHPLKNRYKIVVMITSLIEMLELPKFGHMTTLQYNLSHMLKFC